MGKWKRIDPADIKVGDRVKVDFGNGTVMKGTVDHFNDFGHVYFGSAYMLSPSASGRTWYVRKPKHPKLKAPKWAEPLTRPDEPPVGTFFRVERTGQVFARVDDLHCNQYLDFTGVVSWPLWVNITEPGDTITLLDLVERDA